MKRNHKRQKMVRPGTSSVLTNGTAESTDSSSESSDVGICINNLASKNGGGGVANDSDIAQVYILQPSEIMKNIDLMRTIAILMENRLQGSVMIKALEEEKLRDIYGDIERFPEAFQKFQSIVHQVQYLNVTSDWNYAENGDMSAAAFNAKKGSIFKRLFSSGKYHSNPAFAELSARKEVMLSLLSTLQQVFNRYLKIQTALEDRAKKIQELLRTQEQAKKCSNVTVDSDEDDPNMPLLVPNAQRNYYRLWLERMETLEETLRKTKRSASEVQDSIDVLRDLIKWDYKQVVSPPNVTPWPRPPSSSFGASESCQSGNGHVRVYNSIGESQLPPVQMNHEYQAPSNENSQTRRVWTVSAIVAGAIVILVILAALSFLRFRY